MSVESDVKAWTKQACALVDGVPLDYIAIHVRAGAKSWPEHASVRVEQRPADDIVEEVSGHVLDIGESARSEGRNSWAVRLKLVRAKTPAGSRTFNSNSAPGGGREEEDDGLESPKEALVATVQELRRFGVEMGRELGARASDGYKLAMDLSAKNQALLELLMESNAKVAILEGLRENQTDPIDKSIGEALVNLPTTLANMKALADARREMAEAEVRAAASRGTPNK